MDNISPQTQGNIPTLPLFIDESNRVDVNIVTPNSGINKCIQTNEIAIPVPANFRSNDYRRYRRKGRKCISHLPEKHSSMKEEVLVHSSRQKHHYHHRRKGHTHVKIQNHGHLNTENNMENPNQRYGGGEQSTSEILDTFSQDEAIQGNLSAHSAEQNIPQEILVELERLRAVNSNLKRCFQANVSSADSGYQASATEVIKIKEEEIKNLQLNILQLGKLQQDLVKQRDTLKSQLEAASNQRNNSSKENLKMKELEIQNEKLSEDVKILKDLVCKYNTELENYQERLNKCKGHDSGAVHDVMISHLDYQGKNGDLAWDKINKETLGPLLLAYSETIQEKNDLIQAFEQNQKKCIAKCKTLAEENGKLYQELEDLKLKNEELETNWNVLKDDSTVTHEHNELLTKQLDVQKEKIQEVHGAYQQRVSGISKDLEEVCSKYHTCRGDLLTLQGRYTVLREEYDKLKNETQSKIPFSVHSASVAECRKLFEELKIKYETDKRNMSIKIAELEAEKPQIEGKLVTCESENEQLLVRVDSMEKSLKKTQSRYDSLQGKLVAAQVSRDSAKRQLQKAMAFAEELVVEQERLLKQLHKKQEETHSIARLGSTIVYRMGSLRTKLKNVQQGAWQELEVIEKRIKQQEAGVDHMKKEYHQEVIRLRNLVRQKETIIGRLQREKSKTEENLEVVWRAATSEDIHIKETLKQVNFQPTTSHIKFFKECDSSNGTI